MVVNHMNISHKVCVLDQNNIRIPKYSFLKKKLNVHICHLQQVQSKVNLKYDSWHKEVLSKFGQMLGQNMQDFHAQISKVDLLWLRKMSFDHFASLVSTRH